MITQKKVDPIRLRLTHHKEELGGKLFRALVIGSAMLVSAGQALAHHGGHGGGGGSGGSGGGGGSLSAREFDATSDVAQNPNQAFSASDKKGCCGWLTSAN